MRKILEIYEIDRGIHGRLELRNFSSSVTIFFNINTNEMPNHFTFLAAKGAIYHVTIATVIFSRMLRYRVFARKFAWYFNGVYIIKKVIK